MLWTELGTIVKVPELSALSKQKPSHKPPTPSGVGVDTQNIQAVGQLISSTGLAGPLLGHLATIPSPTQGDARVLSLFPSSPLAAGPAVPEPAPPRLVSVNAQSQGSLAPHCCPGSPHRDHWSTPFPLVTDNPILPRSPGPSRAACIAPWHLSQFPVSLHLSRDQGADGVQVTSPIARDFPETKRTADEPLWSRKGYQHVTRAKGSLHRRTPRP